MVITIASSVVLSLEPITVSAVFFPPSCTHKKLQLAGLLAYCIQMLHTPALIDFIDLKAILGKISIQLLKVSEDTFNRAVTVLAAFIPCIHFGQLHRNYKVSSVFFTQSFFNVKEATIIQLAQIIMHYFIGGLLSL